MSTIVKSDDKNCALFIRNNDFCIHILQVGLYAVKIGNYGDIKKVYTL